ANDVLQFDGIANTSTNNDFAANTQFNGISFLAGANSFTLAGNAVLLGGNITDNSPNAQTIALPLVLNGATSTVSVTAGGSLALGQVTFGSAPMSTVVSGMNINNSVSATGLWVQTNSATANTIAVASGATFTINGTIPASPTTPSVATAFILGSPSTSSAANTAALNITGTN